jgi:hypothetical protein
MENKMSEAIFDLEQAVMNCWEIVEDLKLLRKTVPSLSSAEKVQEQIRSIESVYQMRFDNMWSIFEELCSEHHRFRRMAETGRASPVGFDDENDEPPSHWNTMEKDTKKQMERGLKSNTQDTFHRIACKSE